MGFFHDFAKWHMGLGLNDWGVFSYSKYEIYYVFGERRCASQFCDGVDIDIMVDSIMEKFRKTQMKGSFNGEKVSLIINLNNVFELVIGLSFKDGASSFWAHINKVNPA